MTDTRQDRNTHACTVLQEVIALGVAAGHFTDITNRGDLNDAWRYVNVLTPAGLAFTFSAGAYDSEGKIKASIGSIARNNIKADVRDTNRRANDVSAACTATRGAAAVLKDLMKRVIDNPEAIETAQAVLNRWNKEAASREALLGHVKALEALGYTFMSISGYETYRAKGYGRQGLEPSCVEVTASGNVRFDVSCDVSQMGDILATLSPKSAL